MERYSNLPVTRLAAVSDKDRQYFWEKAGSKVLQEAEIDDFTLVLTIGPDHIGRGIPYQLAFFRNEFEGSFNASTVMRSHEPGSIPGRETTQKIISKVTDWLKAVSNGQVLEWIEDLRNQDGEETEELLGDLGIEELGTIGKIVIGSPNKKLASSWSSLLAKVAERFGHFSVDDVVYRHGLPFTIISLP
jgi:hypothetical protein